MLFSTLCFIPPQKIHSCHHTRKNHKNHQLQTTQPTKIHNFKNFQFTKPFTLPHHFIYHTIHCTSNTGTGSRLRTWVCRWSTASNPSCRFSSSSPSSWSSSPCSECSSSEASECMGGLDVDWRWIEGGLKEDWRRIERGLKKKWMWKRCGLKVDQNWQKRAFKIIEYKSGKAWIRRWWFIIVELLSIYVVW